MKTIDRVIMPLKIDDLWDALYLYRDVTVYAGGTDVFVKLRQGTLSNTLICLGGLSELRGVYEHREEIHIGACTTLAEVASNPIITEHLPLLARAVMTIGSPLIRNMATIGGNICTASPAGDSLPALYVLKAELEIQSQRGSTRTPITDFITAPRRKTLKAGDILKAIIIKKNATYQINHFEKVGLRKANAISVVSMAASINLNEKGLIGDFKGAWGAVSPTVFMSEQLEAFMHGKPLDERTLKDAAVIVSEQIAPIDDLRASSWYRRKVAGNLLLRLLL